MKKKLLPLSGFLVFFLSGCFNCDTVIVDNGPLSQYYLDMIPYQDGEQYLFEHSGGKQISFFTHRENLESFSFCEDCCEVRYKYDQAVVTLFPDYPLFNFNLFISNSDTTQIDFTAEFMNYIFVIPSSDGNDLYDDSFIGSYTLDEVVYENVFGVTSYTSDLIDNNSELGTDSLYYSYQDGIIKLIMSNGEYYKKVD